MIEVIYIFRWNQLELFIDIPRLILLKFISQNGWLHCELNYVNNGLRLMIVIQA